MNEPTKLRSVEHPVDEDVVKVLEYLLAEAKQGTVIALAGIACRVGQEHESFYVGNAPLSQVMYALECWKLRRLQNQLAEVDASLVKR